MVRGGTTTPESYVPVVTNGCSTAIISLLSSVVLTIERNSYIWFRLCCKVDLVLLLWCCTGVVVDLNLCKADLVGFETRGCSTFYPLEHSTTVGSVVLVTA